MMKEESDISPLSSAPVYWTSTHKQARIFSSSVVTAIGLLGLGFAGHAAWKRTLQRFQVAAIAASSAILIPLPWCFKKTSTHLQVLDKSLSVQDLLTHLQTHPEIEEIDLERWTTLPPEEEDPLFALFEYLSQNQRLQKIQGRIPFKPTEMFKDFDFNNPSGNVISYCKKLTHFPSHWFDLNDYSARTSFAKLQPWFERMPHLSTVDLHALGFEEGAPIEIARSLYSRKTPPALLLFHAFYLKEIIEAFGQPSTPLKEGTPEAKFFASLLHLSSNVYNEDLALLYRILPYCKNLLLLDVGSVTVDIDLLAKAIAKLDPKKLNLILSRGEQLQIFSFLEKGSGVPESTKTVLKFIKQFTISPGACATVAITLLTEHPKIHFEFLGTIEKTDELHEALKKNPFPRMLWKNFSKDLPTLNSYIRVLNSSDLESKELLPHIHNNCMICVDSPLEKNFPSDALPQDKMFFFKTYDAYASFPENFNPLAFHLETGLTKDLLHQFKEKGYEPCLFTIIRDNHGVEFFDTQLLDTHFKKGSRLELLPDHFLYTLSEHTWAKDIKNDRLNVEFTYEDDATGYKVVQTIYFTQPKTMPILQGLSKSAND
ncbi:MAG: hypothetical protein JSR80_06190 [Verrucomicrobia bacterium]|nr:hypothetical protein [Verrucomicrobiota bacterium]